jgi:hypothetical protein
VKDVANYKWSSYSEYTESRQIVDKEYALNMFSDKPDEAIVRFVKFLREANEDICLEIPGIKVNVSDDDLRQMVRQEFGIDAVKICNEPREKTRRDIESNERSWRHEYTPDSTHNGIIVHKDLEVLKQSPCPFVSFMRKATEFAKNLRGAQKFSIDGAVEGVKRYVKNGKYIDLAPDGTIISFGKR